MAQYTRNFENEFAKKINAKHALMVNSGSSANLLAVFAAGNPLKKNHLKRGDEVLAPVLCWSTSIWPLVQFGLKPVFVDVDMNTLNINVKELKRKITKKTKAIMLINVLGISSDLYEIKKIAKKYKLIILEDNCESLGSKLKNKYLGTFGNYGTFSFYYSHQITSGEGGMITCDNDRDYEILFSLRSHGWFGGTRFYSRKFKSYNIYAKKYPNLDPRYIFSNSGFNLRPTDIQAAIGLSQFKSLNSFVKIRKKNRDKIIKSLLMDQRWNNQVNFVFNNKNVKPSWFGLSMLLNKKYKNKKNKIFKKLDEMGIENRPIISGNFLQQPALKKYNLRQKSKDFPNANFVHEYGLFVGLKNHPLSQVEIKKFANIFFKAFKK